MLGHLLLFAEETSEKAPSGQPFWFTLLPLFILVFFYFVLMRPMRRQQADQQTLIANLKKNDKVLTRAGIYGTVVSISDTEDEIVVKVDDNVRLRMLKESIQRNLTQEEALKASKGSNTGGSSS